MLLSQALYEINFQEKRNQGRLYEQILSVHLQSKVDVRKRPALECLSSGTKKLQPRDSKYLWNECRQVV